MVWNPILGLVVIPGFLYSQHHPSNSDRAPTPEIPSLALEGSGTSRLPEAAPMFALHSGVEAWEVMTHGSLYLRYTSQNINNSDARGEDEIDAPNWLMVMGGREFSGEKHRLDLRGMLSLDRLTEGGNGYPLLFATGETWNDKPLVDRQHPHDFFMELAGIFSHRLERDNQVFLYLGMPGEPALGPTAFMHRPANQTNPSAVISHHNQDATHITFGVATVGWMNRNFKIDGSVFTGREPDEERYGFDRPRFDSYSLRLAYHPDRYLATQVSAGFLKGPEALEPDEDILRVTASILHVRTFAAGNFLSSGFIYGGNFKAEDEVENSFTLESEWDWNLGTTYGRAEAVQKRGHDLGIDALAEETFWANGFTLGASIRLFRRIQMQMSLGAQATVNSPEEELQADYGEFPISAEVFLRIGPDIMMMGVEKRERDAGHRGHDVGGHGGH